MSSASLSLRPAVEEDCALLHEWVNDPAVRAASFSRAPIPWDEHRRWFAAKLRDPRCLLFIAVASGHEPIGQIRFDADERGEAIVSVSLAAAWRGQGRGTEAIRLATLRAWSLAGLTAIHAYIRPENEASVRAFARAGYGAAERVVHRGEPALRMTYR